MQRITKKLKFGLLLFFLAFAVSGITVYYSAAEVQAAAKNGFYTENGDTYYYKNGKKLKGWQTIDGKKYYFFSTGKQKTGWLTYQGNKYYFQSSSIPKNRYMVTGWRQDKAGARRYFDKNGVLATGWYTISGDRYYFNPTTGVMKTGWKYVGKDRYYFTSSGIMVKNKLYKDTKANVTRYFGSDGKMVRGWYSFTEGQRYFSSSVNNLSKDGIMAVGFTTISEKTYYFLSSTGYKVTSGWVTRKSDNAKFYMDPDDNGAMVTDTEREIAGITYVFAADGTATKKAVEVGPSTGTPTGTKTIKNYLKGALLPVGQVLYVWGGGWTQSTVKGLAPEWKNWYDSQSSSYNYNYYRDLTVGNRIKGLDCSGFVGWTAYQVMHTKSNEGSGYTVVSGSVGSTYQSRGWGTIITQAYLASTDYTICPGDVGYNAGHTWIMLGQCKDKSCVIVHSTPNSGVQLAGTPTPAGNYSSEAVALAKKYMSYYTGYTGKYAGCYKPSTGNYVRNGQFLRWNRATLADPDGYMNMTADQILKDLYGF